MRKPKAGRARADRPAGFADLEAFVEDVHAGRIPWTGAVERITGAFQRVLDGSLAPADLDAALNLRRKRGRPKGDTTFGELRIRTGADMRGLTIDELYQHLDPVCRFIAEHMEANPKRRGARERALDAAVKKFGTDKRFIEKRWKRGRWVIGIRKALRGIDARVAPATEAVRRFNATAAPVLKAMEPCMKAPPSIMASLPKLAAAQELVRRHISDEELDGEMGDLEFAELVEIARARAARTAAR